MKIHLPTLLPIVCLIVAPPLSGQEIVQLEAFNVTAQKRVQSIAEVPLPITAYSGTFLERAGVTDYKSLAPLVPGLFIQEQSPNNPGINLRGITTDSGDPRAETRISIFQDGISISRSRASVVELFDLERIEVLKGPQGTLFGRGAEIGAISIVQNKPQDTASGSLDVGIGSENERRASGHLNVPVSGQPLFARFAFAWREHDGRVENLADGSDLNGRDTLALRGSLRWQPTAQTSLTVIANWQHDTPPGTAFKSGVIPTSRGDTHPFTAAELNRGRALRIDRTVGGVTGIFEHEFNRSWSLTGITGWREYDAFEQFDADGARIYLLEFAEDSRGRQFSQEIRVNFRDGGPFSGFAGVSYFHENGRSTVPFYTDERHLWPFLAGSFRDSLLAGGLPPALVNAAVPAIHPFIPQPSLPATMAAFNNPALPASVRGLAGLAGVPLQPYRADEYTQVGRTRATDAFVDGTWRITPRFELTGGLRVTQERIDSGYEARNGSTPTLGFIVNAIEGYPYLPTNGRRNASNRSTSWDGRLIGRYEFSKTLNAYTGVARGHRPKGLLVSSTSTRSVREEDVVNYEGGFKGTLAANRLQWSASIYQYDYAHFQTTVQSLGRFTLVDAGNATGRGAELALQGHVSPRLQMFATYALTKATFDETSDGGARQEYANNTFRLTPRNSGSLGGTFTLPLSRGGALFVTPVWQYRSRHYFEDNNHAFGGSLRQDGFAIVNLRAGWRSSQGRWQVTASAENLFDKEYLIDAGNVGGSFGIPTFVAGDARRFGIRASRHW